MNRVAVDEHPQLSDEVVHALEARQAYLDERLVPASRASIRGVLASLAGMPAKGEDDPAKARALFEVDLSDLEASGLPLYALVASARAYRMGEVIGQRVPWRPTAGEIRIEAVNRAIALHAEQRRIMRVLAACRLAPALPEPLVSRDRWEALKGEIEQRSGDKR